MANCSVLDCESLAEAKGVCLLHYHRISKYGDPYVVKKRYRQAIVCSIGGCELRPHAKDLCSKHYEKLKIYGDPLVVKSERHGLYNTPEYGIWAGMKQRCHNPNEPQYKDYGGRGITMCSEWLRFSNFYRDMGQRPSSDYSIERLDNDKGYSKENCVWATNEQQANNKRDSRFITYDGRTKTVANWSREVGLKQATILYRLGKGLTPDKLFSPPNTAREIIINGESHTVAEWSRISGVKHTTLNYRIAKGVEGENLLRPTYYSAR